MSAFQRSGGTSVTVSAPLRTVCQKLARSGEPGNTQAMPTTATSRGAGSGGGTAAGRSTPRSASERDAWKSAAPVVTAVCSSSTVVTAERSTVTWPAMNRPSAS